MQRRHFLLASCAALAACATGPTLQSAGLPPIPAGRARIFVYRLSAFAGSFISGDVVVDGAVVGRMPTGSVLYVDVEPGEHVVMVTSEQNLLTPVTVEDGEAAYVRVDVTDAMMFASLRPTVVEPIVGQHEASGLSYTGR